MKGALYQFNCDEGSVLSGSPTIFCDGKTWNDTLPTCLSPPGEPSLKLRVDDEPFGRMEDLAVLRAGQTVSLRCTSKGGNPVPSLTFTKNGETFGPGPKAYQNTHNFVATPEDNGAVLLKIGLTGALKAKQFVLTYSGLLLSQPLKFS